MFEPHPERRMREKEQGTMPTTHEFFVRQHERLNHVEASVVRTQTELDEARNEALDSLRAKREKAAAARQAFQSKFSEAVNKMKANVEARKAQTDATIAEWKHKREVNKLENRARDLEDYADAAMAVLELAQEEARQASLEAIEARLQAEEAKAVGTAV
jgi:hypothetical protein